MAYDFDKIAEKYDRLNHIMTFGLDRRWRRRAVKQLLTIHRQSSLRHTTPPNVLDVACGTGDLSLELLKQGCQVTGVDLSSEMLAIAKQKTTSADFLLADAEHLPFPDAAFDAVTCAFGVRNFVHLEQGLNEMSRVLKQDGCIIILEMSVPDSVVVRPFYDLYTRRVIPRLGEKIAGNREAYTYLPESIKRFPKGEEMLQILESVGLHGRQKKYFFGVCRMYKCKKIK